MAIRKLIFVRLAVATSLVLGASSIADAPTHSAASTLATVSTTPLPPSDSITPTASDSTSGSDRASTIEPAPASSDTIERAVVHVQTEDNAGSGFVVSISVRPNEAPEAHVITAAHVLGDATTATVWFSNGARRESAVIARDEVLDLAVLLVPRVPRSVEPLSLAANPNTPALGDPVWAWGYPFEAAVVAAGFSRAPTVSAGIISARRTRQDVHYLQTDAAVNPGNSGGPLIDSAGLVVGITTFILTPDGKDPEGLNFALDLAAYLDQLLALFAGEVTADLN